MTLLTFWETNSFTRKVLKVFDDDDIAEIQFFLCENPDFGKIIKGSGGIRKLRWKVAGRGKSGGVRIIYYWLVSRETILFLDLYTKNEKEDLADTELRELRQLLSRYIQ